MRLGGSIGPRLLRLSWTYWRSRPRRAPRHWWAGKLDDGWTCPHHHTREDTAEACAQRELRRRAREGQL